MPSTIRLHRVLRAPPERVYRAFIDPAAMVKWLPPNGFTATMHHMEAKVGGGYKMSFTNFSHDQTHSFGGKFLELKPGDKLVYTDQFDVGMEYSGYGPLTKGAKVVYRGDRAKREFVAFWLKDDRVVAGMKRRP